MKLGLPEHVCKYFSGPWRNHRYCKQCKKDQYNYSGKWEDEISLEKFVGKYIKAMGNGIADLRIEVGSEFEFDCYESWGTFYDVSIYTKGEWHNVGKCANLNHADFKLQILLTTLENLA